MDDDRYIKAAKQLGQEYLALIKKMKIKNNNLNTIKVSKETDNLIESMKKSEQASKDASILKQTLTALREDVIYSLQNIENVNISYNLDILYNNKLNNIQEKNMNEELVLNMTDNQDNSYLILKIDEYNIWSDNYNIGIINTEKNSLVFYDKQGNSDNNDFIAAIISKNINLDVDINLENIRKIYLDIVNSNYFKDKYKNRVNNQLATIIYNFLLESQMNEIKKPEFYASYEENLKILKYVDCDTKFKAYLSSDGVWKNFDINKYDFKISNLQQIQQNIEHYKINLQQRKNRKL